MKLKISQREVCPKPPALLKTISKKHVPVECSNAFTNSLATLPQNVEPQSLRYCGLWLHARLGQCQGMAYDSRAAPQKTCAPSSLALICLLPGEPTATFGTAGCYGEIWREETEAFWAVPGSHGGDILYYNLRLKHQTEQPGKGRGPSKNYYLKNCRIACIS